MSRKWLRRRKRIFEIIEVGYDLDYVSRGYDFINAFAIILNIAVSLAYTFEEVRMRCGALLLVVEAITVAFFCNRLCIAFMHS